MKQGFNRLNQVLAAVLAIAALASGQAAWADEPSNIELSTTISGGSLALYSNETCTEGFDADVTAGATVYVKATPAPGYTAIGVTITAEEANTSAAVSVSAVSGTLDVYQFTMPANGNAVTVSATFATPALQQVSYVDENYETQTVNAYVLDETMRTLAGGFYVVPNGLALDHEIGSNSSSGSGGVNIIIPDGKTLACGTADSPLSGYAFSMSCDLSFYGQTNATGKLAINTTSYGVSIGGHITVAHLDVNVVGGNSGISCSNGSIFAGHQTNGNTVTVHNNGYGIGGGSSSVTIKYCDVDIISGSSSYGSAFGITCAGGVTIEGIATGDKVNTVSVCSNSTGISGGSSSVNIQYCDVDIVSESSNAINCANNVTITGRADGSNTIKVHSKSNAISNGYSVIIQYCDVDIVNESSAAITCSRGVFIEGVATGNKVNTVNIRSAGSGIGTSSQGVTFSYCNVEITGTTKTNDIYDPCVGAGISCSGGVTITGRTDGNNTVKVRCGANGDSNSYGISGGTDAVTISHCDVDIVSKGGSGIFASNNVIITGGKVDVTGGTGRYGIDSSGSIILGWTSATDYIKVSSYHVGTGSVKTADGQRFVAYDGETGPAATAIVSGASNDSNPTFTPDAIGGKTLRPLIGHYASVPEHVAVTGKTADFTIGTTSYYICDADENIELSYSGDVPEGYAMFYSYNDGTENHNPSGNTFTMPANDAIVSVLFAHSFASLQEQLDASSKDAANPTVITLNDNYLANSTDSRLSVPSGHHVVLDLNGYKIDRRLTEATSSGYVIVVANNSSNTDPASLVIRDSQGGGIITGGYTSGSAGGISVSGILTLEGGTICGNKSKNNAAGVGVSGTFNMTGGSIINNTNTGSAGNGSAIWGSSSYCHINISGGTITGNKGKNTIYVGGAMSLSGTYDISNNTKADGTATPNIMLYESVITINGALSPTTPVTVDQEGGNVQPAITSGWGTYMSGANAADCFVPFASGKVSFVYNNEVNINTQAVLDEMLSSRYTITLSDGITAIGAETVNYNGTEYYSAGSTITLSGGGDEAIYIVNGTPINGNTFEMPAQNVTVEVIVPVPYIAADGTEQTCSDFTIISDDVIPIDSYDNGTIGTNGKDTWYVATGNYTFSHNYLEALGHVHLILCDGATFTVSGSSYGIFANSLTIYGQSQGTGSLVARTTRENNAQGAINFLTALTINGGNVSTSTVSGDGISTGSDNCTLTINGGTVDATGANTGIECNGNIFINGGNVNATGGYDGIACTGNITLGWTSANDRITASSYVCDGTISVKEGQAFSNGSEILSGTLYEWNDGNATGDLSQLDGKTLQPAMPAVVLADDADNTDAISNNQGSGKNVVLSGRTLWKDGAWNTLCLPFDVSTTSGTLADAEARSLENATLSNGVLTLYFSEPVEELLAGTPYIIKWEGDGTDNLIDPTFTNVTISEENNNFTSTDEKVNFKGTYAPVSFNAGDQSILFMGSSNTLYYPGAAMNINAFRAYFQLNGSNAVKTFVLNFGEDNATSIDHSTLTIDHSAGEWYDLDGRKLSGKPTQRGIYINNGRKVLK